MLTCHSFASTSSTSWTFLDLVRVLSGLCFRTRILAFAWCSRMVSCNRKKRDDWLDMNSRWCLPVTPLLPPAAPVEPFLTSFEFWAAFVAAPDSLLSPNAAEWSAKIERKDFTVLICNHGDAYRSLLCFHQQHQLNLSWPRSSSDWPSLRHQIPCFRRMQRNGQLECRSGVFWWMMRFVKRTIPFGYCSDRCSWRCGCIFRRFGSVW